VASKEAQEARMESLFREVNERITARVEELDDATVVCECGDASCIDHIHIPLERYDQVRSEPTQFIVKTGHVEPDVERVVAGARGYAVVEKDEPEAAAVSEEVDPRS
jgi:hypothetical protein